MYTAIPVSLMASTFTPASSLEDTTLTLRTQNSLYSCPLDELCCKQEEEGSVRELLLEQLPQHQDVLANLVFRRHEDCPLPLQNAKLGQLDDQTLSSIAAQLTTLEELPASCYVLCVNLQCSPNYLFSGFFKKGADSTVSLLLKKPLVHLGMFQDSVLCWGGEDDTYDLRYFPYPTAIRTYHALYDANTPTPLPYFICNVGTVNMAVNDTDLPPMACYKVLDDQFG